MAKKDYFKLVQDKREEREKDSSSSSGNKTDYFDLVNRKRMENTIGFDTLQSDLDELHSSHTKAFEEWQTEETMKNIASSTASMRDRLTTLSEYTDKYGVDGIEDIDGFKNQIKSYNDYYSQALGSIKSQGKVYKQYKKAEDYTADKTKLAELSAMTSDDISPYLNGDNPIAYTTRTGKDITWQGLYDEKKHNEMVNSEEAKEGWKKYKADVKAKEEEEENRSWWEKALITIGSSGDTSTPTGLLTQTINDKRADDSYMLPTNSWTRDEEKIFGAYYYDDPEKAYEYAINLNNQKSLAKKNEEKEDRTLAWLYCYCTIWSC